MNTIQKKEIRKKRLILILILILILVLGALSLYWYLTHKDDGNLKGKIGSLPGTPQEELQKVADASEFSFKINGNPTFKTGNSKGDLNIENPKYNTYPIQIIINLKSNNEEIFKTDLIEPNHFIDDEYLEKDLSKGNYKAVATIKAFDPKTKKYLGEAKANLNINVLS